jgi:large subunit ribosomal protein L21
LFADQLIFIFLHSQVPEWIKYYILMYAIVEIAGQQFKVEKDQQIFVNRLNGEEGEKVDFYKVLLIDTDGSIKVGTPIIENIVVKATILSHLRGDTIKVFKKKRRKGYQKLNGHRQYLTKLQIDGIGEAKAKQKAAAKKEEGPKAEVSQTAEKFASTETETKLKVKTSSKTTKVTAAKEVAAPKAKKTASTAKKTKIITKAAPKATKKVASKKEAEPKAKTAKKAGKSTKEKTKK